jgi:hypothetical protein
MISSPVKGLIPLRAARAGFFTTVIFIKPGITNVPAQPGLTCFSMTSVKQSRTATTSFLPIHVASVIVLIIALFDTGSLKEGNFTGFIFFAVVFEAVLDPALLVLALVLEAADFPFDFLFILLFFAMFFPH